MHVVGEGWHGRGKHGQLMHRSARAAVRLEARKRAAEPWREESRKRRKADARRLRWRRRPHARALHASRHARKIDADVGRNIRSANPEIFERDVHCDTHRIMRLQHPRCQEAREQRKRRRRLRQRRRAPPEHGDGARDERTRIVLRELVRAARRWRRERRAQCPQCPQERVAQRALAAAAAHRHPRGSGRSAPSRREHRESKRGRLSRAHAVAHKAARRDGARNGD